MYKEYFGLHSLPFNLTPDPEFLFLPAKHREAFTGLSYAILERKGFVVLTGDAGTGKTTLLGGVLGQLPEAGVQTSVIFNPTLSPSEFLEGVLLDFGICDIPTSKAQRLWRLQEFLAKAHRENKIVVLIIDEAHKLSFELLEEIRLLGNYEFGPHKLLQILLIGQCELNQLLNRDDLRQFKQRIALRLYIDPLSPSEAAEYIAFRWAKAGGKDTHPFTAEAVNLIAKWSRGIARLINSLCDTALLTAYAEGIHEVNGRSIRAAATNLALVDTAAAASSAEPVIVAKPAEEPFPPREEMDRNGHMDAVPDITEDDFAMPMLASYGGARANSSFLRRLAGKFGLSQ